jgi:hypothetical protein
VGTHACTHAVKKHARFPTTRRSLHPLHERPRVMTTYNQRARIRKATDGPLTSILLVLPILLATLIVAPRTAPVTLGESYEPAVGRRRNAAPILLGCSARRASTTHCRMPLCQGRSRTCPAPPPPHPPPPTHKTQPNQAKSTTHQVSNVCCTVQTTRPPKPKSQDAKSHQVSVGFFFV